MSSQTIDRRVTFEIIDCCNCGMLFGLTEEFLRRLRTDGRGFYCPNGHSLVFNNNENKRLKQKLDELAGINVQLRHQIQASEFAEQKARAELKRIQTRTNAGVCPCCNRTFQQLARHMKTKHGVESLKKLEDKADFDVAKKRLKEIAQDTKKLIKV